MTTPYYGWAEKVAAEIASEKRTAVSPITTDTMRLAMIRRETARRGASDDTVVQILEGLMVVSDGGEIVERDTGKSMDQFLDEMQSTNPNYFCGNSTTARQVKSDSAGQINPFAPGPHFNRTAQVIMMKSDPELAEHFEYLASIGK